MSPWSQVGITLAARSYNFDTESPFQITDILDLHAVVKHSVPMCADSRDLLENGKLKLAEVSYNHNWQHFLSKHDHAGIFFNWSCWLLSIIYQIRHSISVTNFFMRGSDPTILKQIPHQLPSFFNSGWNYPSWFLRATSSFGQ